MLQCYADVKKCLHTEFRDWFDWFVYRLCCCTDAKSLSNLEKPRESASAPALEAAVPETSHRSSVSSKSLTHKCSCSSVHWALFCNVTVSWGLLCAEQLLRCFPLSSAQYRQVKRGSLGAVTMSQLMKRQLEHQSSAPQNINTWDTGQSSASFISTFLSLWSYITQPTGVI